MKKVLLFLMVFVIVFASVPAFAATEVKVEIDGAPVKCQDVNGNEVSPLLIEGTTYLPVRAISKALNLEIEWEDSTKSVFINGKPEKSEKSDNVNIYINGTLFTAKDALGNAVHPILKDGSTYLPIRAIGEAFGKRVSWIDETKTAVLSTPRLATDFSEDKTYAIINKASEKAISVTDNGLTLEKLEAFDYQLFKFIPSDTEGYYYIQSVTNGKNFDVNGNSKNKGAKIITYNAGTADNQKFGVEKYGEGHNDYIIYALSSKLPIEDSVGTVKQNILRGSDVQRWEICVVEKNLSPENSETNTVYRSLTADGFTLSDNNNSLWEFIPNENGEYVITNKETQKSLDVANQSKTSGDPIITYQTSGNANQRWTIEKQDDGTYLIKSVHSSLYLTVSDSGLIQAEKNQSYKQKWAISVVE